MSMFSGKCDFYDSFVAIRSDGDDKQIEENLKKLKLYIYGKDGRTHRLKSDTIKDIAKYYPYLESIMAGDKDGTSIVILSSDSFIDQEERQRLGYYIDDVKKYYKRCKRKKEEFTVDKCVAANGSYWCNTDLIHTIAKRFADHGLKAEFNDIHLPMQEHFRREWFEELVRVGYTEQEAYNWAFNGFLDPPEVEEKRLGRPVKKG